LSDLTIREKEQAREQAGKAMRARLEERRPDALQYTTESRDSRVIAATLTYSKAAVPLIAILAALASSVRTVQVVSTIYASAGSHPVGVLVASLAFTLAAEGALFVLALAQAGEQMRRRAEKHERHVVSLANIWRAVLVRVGIRPALRHDELPEETGGIGIVIALALVFTLSTNLYLGLKPLIDQLGASSLQNFVGSLWTAPAGLQMTAIVDLTAALFAPLVAFAAGHLTARFASEIAERSQATRMAYERDMEKWRTMFADPLSTDEGRELLEEYQNLKLASKRARNKPKEEPATGNDPFGSTVPILVVNGNTKPMQNGNGHIDSDSVTK
jgi:hypothetical protein